MSKGDEAREYFKQGYNCAQAVLLAFLPETGLDRETAARAALAFGGGLGRQRLTCGAISGMCMALGLIEGSPKPGGKERSEMYAAVQKLCDAFKAKNGSILCGELLSGVRTDASPNAEARTAAYYQKRPCIGCVEDAANLLEAYLGSVDAP